MTHGECWYQEEQSVQLIKGEWVVTNPVGKIPHPLPRKEALRYYNSKLFKYWLEYIDERTEIVGKAKALSLLMFGNSDYKNFVDIEEELCGT